MSGPAAGRSLLLALRLSSTEGDAANANAVFTDYVWDLARTQAFLHAIGLFGLCLPLLLERLDEALYPPEDDDTSAARGLTILAIAEAQHYKARGAYI